jgi:sec-independent protein translocase protein TatB
MLDVGWQELLLIGVVAIIFIGPQELPRVMRTVMGVIRKARSVASEFHDAINEAARHADIEDVKKQLADAGNISPTELLERGLDPGGAMKKEFSALSEDVRQVGYVPPAMDDPAQPAAPSKSSFDPYSPDNMSQPPMDGHQLSEPAPPPIPSAPEPESEPSTTPDRPVRTGHG